MILLVAAASAAAQAASDAAVTASDTPWWTIAPASASASAISTGLTSLMIYRLFQRGREDRRRAQAAAVYAVVGEHDLLESGAVDVHITVHNASDQPIWQVEVKPLVAGAICRLDTQPTLPHILPNAAREFVVRLRADAANGGVPHADQTPWVSFVDHDDQQWHKQGAALTLVDGRRRRPPALRLAHRLGGGQRSARQAA